MCGILALFGEEVEVSSYLLSHRGPDDYRTKHWVNVVWIFTDSLSMILPRLVCNHL
jgi:asparagine synthetase B (glutamine-hydrolysing)